MGVVRITGGEWRGRRLRTPRGDATRPSADQFRGSVLQILSDRIAGARVLDLFAGSGALGLECLSRGAASVVAVERARGALDALRRNAAELGLSPERFRLVAGDAYRPRVEGPFDVLFVAPPYPHFRTEGHRVRRLVGALVDMVAEDGIVIVQAGAGDFHPQGLEGLAVVDERRYGKTTFWLLAPDPSEG